MIGTLTIIHKYEEPADIRSISLPKGTIRRIWFLVLWTTQMCATNGVVCNRMQPVAATKGLL